MSLFTINGVGVISGLIVMPEVGIWSADLVIDQIDGTGFDAGTAVQILCDGGIELDGVVVTDRTGDFLDAVHVSVLGGAGAMAKALPARSYMQPGAFVRDVLSGIATDSGETLDSTIDPAFMSTNLAAWSRMAKSGAWNLRALLKIVAPSFSWRITPVGNLWMGVETWPAASGDFEIIDQSPADGSYLLGCDTLFVAPGVSIEGVGNVAHVEHTVTANHVRSHVLIDLSEGNRGTEGAIARMIETNSAGIDYFAFYRAKVNAQSADLTTLDVTPDDPRLSGMQRIPLRHGLPAFKTQINPGGYILIGFIGGDPRLPFVHSWEGGESVQSLQLGGNTAVVRVGDQVDMGTFLCSGVGPSFAGIVWTPPGGGTPVTITGTGPATNIIGSAKTGSNIVGAG